MTEHALTIRAVDTLLFRDGRPFTTEPGGRAQSLPVPPPSVVAGFLRTHCGRRMGRTDWPAVSSSVRVRGPLLVRNGTPLFAAPADAVVTDTRGVEVHRLKPVPFAPGEGAYQSHGMRPLIADCEGKPARGFAWWPWTCVQAWLSAGQVDPAALSRELAPQVDERVHVGMNAETGTAAEGLLFTTRMVAHEQYSLQPRDGEDEVRARYSLLCQAAGIDAADTVYGPGPLGGENRIAIVEPADSAWPDCPSTHGEALARSTGVRMVLATPAIFDRGWMPAWLDKTTRCGAPPGLEGVTLKLIAAAVPRRQPISGWELGAERAKPVRWAAPAGSVYFFTIEDGAAARLVEQCWLQPVSDDDKDRSDGFGLALWGTWNNSEVTE